MTSRVTKAKQSAAPAVFDEDAQAQSDKVFAPAMSDWRLVEEHYSALRIILQTSPLYVDDVPLEVDDEKLVREEALSTFDQLTIIRDADWLMPRAASNFTGLVLEVLALIAAANGWRTLRVQVGAITKASVVAMAPQLYDWRTRNADENLPRYVPDTEVE